LGPIGFKELVSQNFLNLQIVANRL